MLRFDDLVNQKVKLSVIGLGYVGLPIAVAFARQLDVIGFDINEKKVAIYKQGIDPTNEVGSDVIKETNVQFTTDELALRQARFHIVAVPTPIKQDITPDLSSLESASRVLGRNLIRGSIIVYESTVYPGVTEEICVPILEEESGLICGKDFWVGYSPERINPGDREHRLENITKVVSGIDEMTTNVIAKVYGLVVKAGIYKAESIQIAEAAKVIENAQRDINIAFMNEISIIFNKMNIDTKAVLEAAGTKWNFLKFHPGLVGGHCIGIDPYYLTYKAEQMGYFSQIILSGRKINDSMGKYVAESTIKNRIRANKQVNGSRVVIFGVTFKENCPDVRNTKVIDLINELGEYGVNVSLVDPVADKNAFEMEYGKTIKNIQEIDNMDAVIVAAPHLQFKELMLNDFRGFYSLSENDDSPLVLIDIKGMFDRKEAERSGYLYWRL